MNDDRPTGATLCMSKHHGLGNDFLVALLPEVPRGAAALARRLCDRRRGVGADGLVVATPSSRPGVDLAMRLWNSDGSEAEISGNGIRCLAQAEASRRGAVPVELVIQSAAGDHRVSVCPGATPREVEVRVGMGRPRPGPAVTGVPAAASLVGRRAFTVDLGNPHLVVLVDDPDAVDLAQVGPAIEALFPDGINVHVMAVGGDDAVTLRPWERGAGLTEACGSGAVAAAFAAHEWHLVGRRVQVSMPGGRVVVEVGDELSLVGPSVHVADVHVADVGVRDV